MDYFRSLLTSHDKWDFVEYQYQTVAMRTLAFRSISNAGAKAFGTFVKLHRNYPWSAFLLFEDPAVANRLENESICRFDLWTLAFVEHFRGRLDSQEAKAVLYVLLLLVQVDMAQIEARHATIRAGYSKCWDSHT